MQDDKINIRDLLPEELASELKAMGQPAFRAKQLFGWLTRGVSDWDEMTNLPKPLRASLGERFYLGAPGVLRKQVSAGDGTVKYLWRLRDGNAVETVVMRYHYGNSVCISTQVGCRQGCAFCASTIGGLVRCLTPGEMLEEVMFSEKESGLKIGHIVLMGIGEPLDNFDNVVKFLRLVNHPDGMNIGMRAHLALHLRAHRALRRPRRARYAADALRQPPRARRRDAHPDYAREPRQGRGEAHGRVRGVF